MHDMSQQITVVNVRGAVACEWMSPQWHAKRAKILHCVSGKRAQLWNGIARNYMDRFWWYLAEIFKSL